MLVPERCKKCYFHLNKYVFFGQFPFCVTITTVCPSVRFLFIRVCRSFSFEKAVLYPDKRSLSPPAFVGQVLSPLPLPPQTIPMGGWWGSELLEDPQSLQFGAPSPPPTPQWFVMLLWKTDTQSETLLWRLIQLPNVYAALLFDLLHRNVWKAIGNGLKWVLELLHLS